MIKGVKLIILFGSQARQTAGKISDTDIAVLANHSLSYAEMSEISDKVAGMLKVSEDDIDIVDLWRASPLLQRQAGENGKLLYGKKDDFMRFRVLAWKRYQDTAKFRLSREKALNAVITK